MLWLAYKNVSNFFFLLPLSVAKLSTDISCAKEG